MRAIIIATGEAAGVAPLDERCPVPLIPLVDRPFIQHIIEIFAGQGVTHYDIVLCHCPEKIEHFLGEGERWGSRITYHLAREPARAYRFLKTIELDGESPERILFGHADRLPKIDLKQAESSATGAGPRLFCWRDPDPDAEPPWHWTGWALMTPAQLLALPTDADEKRIEAHLMNGAAAESCRVETTAPLSMETFAGILAAHHAVLAKEFPGLLPLGRETDPGIWIARNVVLHPTARIAAPVYIGADCQVGLGVHLGPHAVVGSGCVLDSHCTVTNSIILMGSYIGEGLELEDVIVDKNRLINARFGGAVTVSDEFILGSLSDTQLSRLIASILARVLALVLLIVAGPVLLIIALCLKICRQGPVLHGKTVVRLPASAADIGDRTYSLWSFSPEALSDWGTPRMIRTSPRDFCLRFLPALINIAKGDLGFVGVPPRSAEEIENLSHDWRMLYLHAKAGIVTEASVRYAADPTDDELYAAEGFYAVTAGWLHDLKLLLGFLVRVLRSTVRTERE